MRRTPIVLAAVLSLIAWVCPHAAFAGDDPATEAVRALVAGAGGETRARAEEIVRADPEAAVRALIGVTAARAETGAIVTLGGVPERLLPDPEPAPDDSEMVVQLYDVKDLTNGKLTGEALAQRLRLLVKGEVSAETAAGGVMVVRAPSPSHAAVKRFLAGLRSKDGTLYQVDARLIVAPMTATVGSHVMRTRPGERVELDDPQASVAEWIKSGDVRVVASPRVSCLRGQTGAFQVGRRISFVADFDVEVAQSAFIADPVIDVVWDGVLAEFTPWTTPEGRIQLALDVAVSDVEEPLETFQTSLGALDQPVTIQIPSYVRTELSRSLVVDDGGAVLVRLADGPDSRRLVLLTVAIEELIAVDGDDE